MRRFPQICFSNGVIAMFDQSAFSVTSQYYSLERPDWLINAGLDKGRRHDRKTLNIIMAPGATIRFRQKTPGDGAGHVLMLLNNDNGTELQAAINDQWRELVSSVPSVPFVSTRYTDVAGDMTEVEIEVKGGWKFLPIYTQGMQDSEFIAIWDTLDAEYALFNCKYANILIPKFDKEVVRALQVKRGLQSLTDYYESVFEYFNELVGIFFESAVPENKNIPNRYFMKADKVGPGAAYYGESWTAESSRSVAGFWLDPEPTNWGCLHEVTHGYQGKFFAHSSVPMGEIWNNVLSHLYQEKTMGENVYREGWLFALGLVNEEEIYEDAKRVFAQGLDLGSVENSGRLIVFFYLLIVWKVGEHGVAEFYKRYRKLSNTVGFESRDYPTMDVLSSVVVDVGNSDISHFMDYVKAPLSRRQFAENAYSGSEPVYPLYLIAPEEVKSLQELLAVRSPLHLVSTRQLLVSGMKGGVIFKFSPDIFDKVFGKSFVLSSGSDVARMVRIGAREIFLQDLPVGIYRLHLPFVEEGKYQPALSYVVVSQGRKYVECTYVETLGSELVDQSLYFRGLSNVFCTVQVNVSVGRLIIDVVSKQPHAYFSGVVYASLTIKNAQGNVVFDLQMKGDDTELLHRELAISPGFSIEIMHREMGVDVSNSLASAVFDVSAMNNILRVTERGLVNAAIATDAGENLKVEIARLAAKFERSPHFVLHDSFPLKEDLKRAINIFAEPVRGELFERYKKVEFSRPAVNDGVGGSRVTWMLKGISDQLIGYVKFDFNDRTVKFEVFQVIPHSYFASVYLSVVLTSASGEIRYLRELRGDVLAELESILLPLNVGDTVSVMHREPSRSVMEVDANGRWLQTGLVQHATHNEPRRLSLASYWPAAAADPES